VGNISALVSGNPATLLTARKMTILLSGLSLNSVGIDVNAIDFLLSALSRPRRRNFPEEIWVYV